MSLETWIPWDQRIKTAIKTGKFTPDDIADSSDYPTCAVVENKHSQEFWDNCIEYSSWTKLLADEFQESVENNKPLESKRILKEIKALKRNEF